MTTGSFPRETPAAIANEDDDGGYGNSRVEVFQGVEEEVADSPSPPPPPGPSSPTSHPTHGPPSEGGGGGCAGPDLAGPQQTGVDDDGATTTSTTEDSFPVSVTVDRAMRLSLNGELLGFLVKVKGFYLVVGLD